MKKQMEPNNVLLNGDFIENETNIENEIQQEGLHGVINDTE